MTIDPRRIKDLEDAIIRKDPILTSIVIGGIVEDIFPVDDDEDTWDSPSSADQFISELSTNLEDY